MISETGVVVNLYQWQSNPRILGAKVNGTAFHLKFILALFGLKTSSFILFLQEFKKNKAAKITKISGTILRIFLEVSVSIILVLF